MLYLDTSFLAPLILEEATTIRIRPFVAGLDEPTISHWTRVEFSSLLGHAVRIRRFGAEVARAAERQLDGLIAESFGVVLPVADDFRRAVEYLQNYSLGLRGPGALHLAVAVNRGAETIYTLDKTLLRAGKLLGLPVSTGVDLPGYGD